MNPNYSFYNDGYQTSARYFSNHHEYSRFYGQFRSRRCRGNNNAVSNGYHRQQKQYDSKQNEKPIIEENNTLTQRDRLINQLTDGSLECLICYETVNVKHHVWSCIQCYNVLHLRCIQKWAYESLDDDGDWRCPACQMVQLYKIFVYSCFCSRRENPKYSPNLIPHSCGKFCAKKLGKCDHYCKLLCHPGPCADCMESALRFCACGVTSFTTVCSDKTDLICDNICNKILSCGFHTCLQTCHYGSCEPCQTLYDIFCPCGKIKKQVLCDEQNTVFLCDNICDKILECGNHKCENKCHVGPCAPCRLLPSNNSKCPCGKTNVNQNRISCLDPILCCDNICDKIFACGPEKPDKKRSVHKCTKPCHLDDCSPCLLKSVRKCRCGSTRKEIPCSQLNKDTGMYEFDCQKPCQKKRNCGKHKCNNICCTFNIHICEFICNRVLSCGVHRCLDFCHMDRCKPCINLSFQELRCNCGHTVIHPPVPCGTRKPHCDQPCKRAHNCDHEVTHNCHSNEKCPPCRVFTTKLCFGKHEERSIIPCSQESFSCGLLCKKPLPCGRHTCRKPCHKGACLRTGDNCTQPCVQPRICGHPCNLNCHEPPCKNSLCKEHVTVTCPCGLIKTSQLCANFLKDYEKIADDKNLSNDVTEKRKVYINFAILECDEDCKKYARNLRFALALHIENPDLSGKIIPRYPESMKQWAKKDPEFCQMVHDKLSELIKLSKESKHKFRSYSFSSMNRYKRQFIHQYCEFFRCESAAYDEEPNRNVVATAVKDKCWLPSMSVVEVIKRENGMRRIPLPTIDITK